MEYTITINQKAIVDAGLLEKMDLVDAAIIDYIRKFRGVNESRKIVIEDVVYVWVAQEKLIQEIPMIKIKTDRGVRKRMTKLEGIGLILPHPNNQAMRKAHYALTQLGEGLYKSSRNSGSGYGMQVGTVVPSSRNGGSYSVGTVVPSSRNGGSYDHNTNTSFNQNHNTTIIKSDREDFFPEGFFPDEDKEKSCAKKESTDSPQPGSEYAEFCKLFGIPHTKTNGPLQNAWKEAGYQEWGAILDHAKKYINVTEKRYRKSALKYLEKCEWINNPDPIQRSDSKQATKTKTSSGNMEKWRNKINGN